MLFDRVIANPPFSQDGWWGLIEANREIQLDKEGKEKKSAPNYIKEVVDKHGRFQYGIPPRSYADLAFLQHMVASLKQNGKAGIVLPHGTLFRTGAEGIIREELLKVDLIEGIIGLPPALFYNTGIPASVWIISKSKPEHLKGKVIIVDASNEFKEGKNQNTLDENNIKNIVNSYDSFALPQSDGSVNASFSRLVDIAEIMNNNCNLNISRYIETDHLVEGIDLKKVKLRISEIEIQEKALDDKLRTLLADLGL